MAQSTTHFRLMVKSTVKIRFSVRRETMPRSPAVLGLQKCWQEERYPAEQFLSWQFFYLGDGFWVWAKSQPIPVVRVRLGERQSALSSLNLVISFSFYFLRELCIYRISFRHTWSYTLQLVWWPVCQVVPWACCSQFTFDNQEIWFL